MTISTPAAAAILAAAILVVFPPVAEYNQTIAQILITRRIMLNEISKTNAQNTFQELFHMGVIPIVNENL